MGIIYKFRQIGLYGPKECKFRQKLCFMIPSKKFETNFRRSQGRIVTLGFNVGISDDSGGLSRNPIIIGIL